MISADTRVTWPTITGVVRWLPAMILDDRHCSPCHLIDVLGSNLGLNHQLVGARDDLQWRLSPITPPTVCAVSSWTRIIASRAVIFNFSE
jgi:hypothetical protein